jgi:hypothetical protein
MSNCYECDTPLTTICPQCNPHLSAAPSPAGDVVERLVAEMQTVDYSASTYIEKAQRLLASMRPAETQVSPVAKWLSAALEDPSVCDEMKADIRAWFDAGEPGPARPVLSPEDRARVESLLRDALDYTGQRYAPIDTEACNEYARLCDAAHDKIREALSLIDKLEAG